MTEEKSWEELFPPAEDGAIVPTGKPYNHLGKLTDTCLTVLIDGDIIAYRAAAPCDGVFYRLMDGPITVHEERYMKDIKKLHAEIVADDPEIELEIVKDKRPEPEGYAIYNVDRIMESIMGHFPQEIFVKTYLTGNVNFRSELDSEYKANRKSVERPVHLNAAKQHLLNRYAAILEDPYEADDLLGIEQMEMNAEGRDTVIVSIDKDLLCIPGKHYNFVKGVDTVQSIVDANRHFYRQCLTGDTVDNIPGIKGIGPKKAEGFIDGEVTTINMYHNVFTQWKRYLGYDMGKLLTVKECRNVMDTVQRSAELLWILREKGVMWTPPLTPQEIIDFKTVTPK